MNAFLKSYLETALWSSTGDDGEPLDKNYSISDIAPESIAKAEKDCDAFQRDNATDLELGKLTDERAGHCLWLNRNGHGSGFWGEYSQTSCERYNKTFELRKFAYGFDWQLQLSATCDCPYHACQRLSDASKALGTSDLYVGDNGQLYFS